MLTNNPKTKYHLMLEFISLLERLDKSANLIVCIGGIEAKDIETLLDMLGNGKKFSFHQNLKLCLETESYNEEPENFVKRLQKVLKNSKRPPDLNFCFSGMLYDEAQGIKLVNELIGTGASTSVRREDGCCYIHIIPPRHAVNNKNIPYQQSLDISAAKQGLFSKKKQALKPSAENKLSFESFLKRFS